MAENLFKIEDARPEDVKTMRTIVKDAWTKIYINADHGITEEDLSKIDWYDPKGIERRKKEIVDQEDNVHVWVLKDGNDEVVGFCKARKDKNKGEIKGMYLVPVLQGKGFGKKLMQKAFDWIGPNLDIRLKVASYNFQAIGFYKKMGFIETGNAVSYEGTQLPSGKEIPRIEMAKKATLA